MADFSAFFETFGKSISAERADSKLLETYKDIVPDQLIEFWERFGFGGYGDGLVWIVSPTALEDVLAEWVPSKGKTKRAIPVVRTAFGNIVYWQNTDFSFLEVHHNKVFQAGSDVEVLFGFYLTDKKSRGSVFEEALFKKASKAFGPLERDEMYAYTLPLAMGGDPSIKNMNKAKMREYLAILAAAHQGEGR